MIIQDRLASRLSAPGVFTGIPVRIFNTVFRCACYLVFLAILARGALFRAVLKL